MKLLKLLSSEFRIKVSLRDDLKQNELRFENSFDQTYLKPFSRELSTAYSKHTSNK